MKNNFSRILGERLLSISEVSSGTGISRSTLTSLYYRRTKTIKLQTLMKICDFLNVSLNELVEYDPRVTLHRIDLKRNGVQK